MGKKGIALIGPFPPPYGGISVYLQTLSGSSLKEDYHVFLCDTQTDGGAIVKTWKMLIQLLFLMKNRREIGIFHIHGGSKTGFWKYVPLFFVGKISNIKSVFHIHSETGMRKFLMDSGFGRLCFNLFLRNEYVIVLSNNFKSFLKEDIKFENVFYVQNSILMSDKKIIGITESENEKFNIDSCEKKIILFFGLITRRKGVHDIISIIPELIAKRQDILFVLAGSSGDFTEGMERFIEKNRDPDSILYFKNVSEETKVQLFSQADIFILPTYSEGLPIALLEAMSYALPVITTRVGAIPDAIEDGRNGFLIKPGDKYALIEKIEYLLDNPEHAKLIGEHNVERIKEKFTHEKMIEKVKFIYEKALNGI